MTTAPMSYQEFEAANAYTAKLHHESVDAPSPVDDRIQTYFIPSRGAIKASSFHEDIERSVAPSAQFVLDITYDDLSMNHWGGLTSTLLMNSGMRGLASKSLSRAATFAGTYLSKPKHNQAALEVFEELGRYADLQNPPELRRFLGNNRDILDLVRSTIKATQLHDEIVQLKAWVFTDPENGNKSLYIGAVVKGDDFDKAYEIENAVFEAALEQNSRLNNFRILLNFETEEDGRPE